MHRKSNYSRRVRIMMALGMVKYCRCDICHGGKWRGNHSDIKYITPNVLRPFDGLRNAAEMTFAGVISLWWSVSYWGHRLTCEACKLAD